MTKENSGKKWIAIITGLFSIFIGLIYLILIVILDARGPMRPPPPEALAEVEVVDLNSFEVVRLPDEELFR